VSIQNFTSILQTVHRLALSSRKLNIDILPGAELPLVESYGLLNDLFPIPSNLDAG
jgi:hypothetical protein